MSKLIFEKALAEIQDRNLAWLVTVINAKGSTPGKIGFKMLVRSDGEITGTIGGGAIEKRVIEKIKREKPHEIIRWEFDLGGDTKAEKAEKTGMICGGQQEVLVDPLFCQTELYIAGAGHCAKALTELANKCDFSVTVLDNRPEFTLPEQHPFAAQVICTPYEKIDKHINFTPNTFIVGMTHGHQHDELVLRRILGKPYKYLGVIGSKKKAQTIFAHLTKAGFDPKELAKVHSPIGFTIGAQTPYEIAVSILAEILAVKNELVAKAK